MLEEASLIMVRTIIGVGAIVALSRLFGLRSFSKMSGFDFPITVAFGSILAAMVTTLSVPLWHFLLALVTLFAVQGVIALARFRWAGVEAVIDNQPRLVMWNGQFLCEGMKQTRMTEADLRAKLREANAYDLSAVRAAVVEATGDVSVIHENAHSLNKSLLDGVDLADVS